MRSLDALFSPRSVAVLGVSRNPAKLGYKLLENVKAYGYGGRIYPVNPSGERILDLPSVTSVAALPEPVDLALVSLPASAVADAIVDLAARGAKAAVILSSGFGEVDANGREAQARLLKTARASGLRLVGPNCMGVYSAPARLNGTYFWDLPKRAGGISVVSQSGAYGGLIFRHLGGRGLGVARFVSIGNQADVDLTDILEFLAADADTTLIACFVEALRDGRRFLDVAARATASKPVVMLKGGRSDAGRRAAGSHTGSLAGAYAVYRAAFRRAGVVTADETEEFFDAIEALAATPRRPSAPAIAVITVSGGPSVVAADCAERAGLAVPALEDAVRSALRASLPPFAAVGNPVDLTPQVEPSRIGDAIKLVFDQASIAGAVAIDVGLDIPEFADALVAEAVRTSKPVVAFATDAPAVSERLRSGGIPVLAGPERAVRAWRALWLAGRGAATRAAQTVRPLAPDVTALLAGTRGALPYDVARRALEACGVKFVREAIVQRPADAVAAAETMGYPVVVKADAPGLVHKTEVGGVRLDLRDAAQVRAACDDLRNRAGAERFIVQQQLAPGLEFLIGARRDEVFGPVVVVGAGGVLTEALGDVGIAVAPVTPADIQELMAEGVRARLANGPRGLPRVDVNALAETAIGVSDLILSEPRIREIDLNPVIASTSGMIAVDAVVVLD